MPSIPLEDPPVQYSVRKIQNLLSPYYARPWRWWCDAWFSYRLASNPSVREQSLDSAMPTLRKHLRWCRRLILRPHKPFDRRSFAWVIVHQNGMQVGQVRYDWDWRLDTWNVGIALLPSVRGLGLGPWLLALTVPDGGRFPVVAEIKWTNGASLRAFEKAGYELDAELSDDGMARMVRARI